MMILTMLAAAAATPPASYRAAGTEPFWNLAISGRTLKLSEPGRADVMLLVRAARPIRDGWRWRSPVVTVEAVHAPCSDGMSDRRYPDRVTVTHAGRTLTGCGGAPAASVALAGTAWRVTAIDGRAIALPRPATLRFEGARLSGHGGCNRFGGDYTVEGDRLVAGPLMTTRMACTGRGGDVERGLLAILAAPAQVTRDGTRVLRLSNAAGSLTLRRE